MVGKSSCSQSGISLGNPFQVANQFLYPSALEDIPVTGSRGISVPQ